jgi:hypothetical protein
LSLRDNHHQIATDFLIQIVALFSPRLSRYSAASYGCIRMLNEDVADLYGRVHVGTRVIMEP